VVHAAVTKEMEREEERMLAEFNELVAKYALNDE
jgi:hypothetical protein